MYSVQVRITAEEKERKGKGEEHAIGNWRRQIICRLTRCRVQAIGRVRARARESVCVRVCG